MKRPFSFTKIKIALNLCYWIILYNSSIFTFKACAMRTNTDIVGSFSFFLYNSNVNLIFPLAWLIVLNYIRFFFLKSFNNISILILSTFVISMYIFSYNILFIHYGGKVPFSFTKPLLLSFSLIL